MAETRASEAVVNNHTEQMARIRAQHEALKLQNYQILEELREIKSLLRGGSVQPIEERNKGLSMAETLETDPQQFKNLQANDKQVRESVVKIEEHSRTGTLHDYDEPFESLLKDGWVTEELAVNLFVGGLRPAILHLVSIFRPRTLDVAYAIVRLPEFVTSVPCSAPILVNIPDGEEPKPSLKATHEVNPQESPNMAFQEFQKKFVAVNFPDMVYKEDGDSDSDSMGETDKQLLTMLCKEPDIPSNLVGNFAPMFESASLQAKHGYVLVVGDTHGALAYGKKGGSVVEAYSSKGDIDISMAILSKAVGGQGGIICCRRGKQMIISRLAPTNFHCSFSPAC